MAGGEEDKRDSPDPGTGAGSRWPKMLEGLQRDPVIEAYKQDVDRSLLRENLKLSPEERLRKLQRALATVEELRRAGRKLR